MGHIGKSKGIFNPVMASSVDPVPRVVTSTIGRLIKSSRLKELEQSPIQVRTTNHVHRC